MASEDERTNQTPKKRGRKPCSELSPHQLRTLRAIQQFTDDHGYSPTIAELGTALGIRGSSVHDQIQQLIRKGCVEREEGKARVLSVVTKQSEHPYSIVPMPIVGQVAAGIPILAEQNVVSEVLMDSSMLRSGVHFGLEVRGDSMIGAGIYDGDLLIVRQQQTAENGDIVVALIGDEATVKRFFHVGNRIELRAENPSFAPILIGPDDDLKIEGKVVAVRNMRGRRN